MFTRSLFLCAALCISVGNFKAQAAVSKSQRRLLIVSSLKKFGMKKYEWLYKFLDASTISMGKSVLQNQYHSVSVLTPTLATKRNFINRLKYLTRIPSVRAVDVILSLHGASNKLWFHDKSYSTNSLKTALQSLPQRRKLRLMYNLACYGASHRNEFIEGGFRSAIGSLKVNTSSASEYPVFLSRYKLGHKIKDIIAQTNADPAMQVSDRTAGFMGFNDANSRKYILGSKSLRISYNAH